MPYADVLGVVLRQPVPFIASAICFTGLCGVDKLQLQPTITVNLLSSFLSFFLSFFFWGGGDNTVCDEIIHDIGRRGVVVSVSE